MLKESLNSRDRSRSNSGNSHEKNIILYPFPLFNRSSPVSCLSWLSCV